MPVFHDPQLNELALKKCDLGARSAIKEVADIVRVAGDTDVIVATWLEAQRIGSLREDFILTIVQIPAGIAYFYKPIDEVRILIENAQPKTKGKVPNRTLTKMIAARINALKKEIQTDYDSKLNHHNFVKTNPAYANQLHKYPQPVLHTFLSDINTKARLEEEFERWAQIQQWSGSRMLRKLRKELLSKPELTDQDVKEAYDLVLAGQVMEE